MVLSFGLERLEKRLLQHVFDFGGRIEESAKKSRKRPSMADVGFFDRRRFCACLPHHLHP